MLQLMDLQVYCRCSRFYTFENSFFLFKLFTYQSDIIGKIWLLYIWALSSSALSSSFPSRDEREIEKGCCPAYTHFKTP